MATPGELVRTVAEALGVPEATVVVHDRNLATGGLRTKSGRGWSAARVTARDAAHLLVAILATAQVKDSVEAVERYRRARPLPSAGRGAAYAGTGVPELEQLPPDHSFVDAIEALIGAACRGDLGASASSSSGRAKGGKDRRSLQVAVSAAIPGTLAEINIEGGRMQRSIRYGAREPRRRSAALRSASQALPATGDLEQLRRFSEKTILRVATLLAPPLEM